MSYSTEKTILKTHHLLPSHEISGMRNELRNFPGSSCADNWISLICLLAVSSLFLTGSCCYQFFDGIRPHYVTPAVSLNATLRRRRIQEINVIKSEIPSYRLGINKTTEINYLFNVEHVSSFQDEYILNSVDSSLEKTINKVVLNDATLSALVYSSSLEFVSVESTMIKGEKVNVNCVTVGISTSCSVIKATVKFSHYRNVKSETVESLLLGYGPTDILEGLNFNKKKYVGPTLVTTDSVISLLGLGLKNISSEDELFFEQSVKDFLNEFLTNVKPPIRILTSMILDKKILKSEKNSRSLNHYPSNISDRHLTDATEVYIRITGKYNPPPGEISLHFIAGQYFDNDGSVLVEILRMRDSFRAIKGVKFRSEKIKPEKKIEDVNTIKEYGSTKNEINNNMTQGTDTEDSPSSILGDAVNVGSLLFYVMIGVAWSLIVFTLVLSRRYICKRKGMKENKKKKKKKKKTSTT